MKKIITILMAMLCVPIAFASTPDFTYTNLLEDEVKNGDQDLGDLLFIENPYVPDRHTKATISSDNFQQYDILEWRGDSIRMIDPLSQEQILVNGSSYYFTRTGSHIIRSMVNSSVSDFIVVSPADILRINITDISVPAGFEIDFERTQFVLNGEESITVDLDVDDDVENGDYGISFKLNGITRNHGVEVLQVINWSIDTSNFTKNPTIKAGDSKYLGRIVIENTGNEDVEIIVSKSGNVTATGMIGLPSPRTLYRKNVMYLDFNSNVPSITKAGKYVMFIEVKGGGEEKEFGMNITVVDAILPTIDNINFSSNKVFVDNVLSVYATDNDDVRNVTVTYEGKTHELKKDGNLFTKEIEFRKLSRYIFKICAYDPQENEVCEIINKTFSKVKVIDDNEKVLKMDSMRFGKYSRIKLFNITSFLEEEMILELVSYDTIPNINLTPVFRVVDADGSIKTFGQYNNEVRLSDMNEYFLEIRADEEVSLTGTIRANLPEQYEAIEDMTFDVSFKTYDVPQDFEIGWVDDRDMVCTVKDTGNLDTSYYECILKYPINTRQEDISVPTTVKERNSFEQEADKVRSLLTTSKNRSGWIIGVMSAILLIVILWAMYIIFWHPYVRIPTGRTTESHKLK
ncbi:MAG: hypothetical protein ACTSWQ_03700 [Candidatus Thorarchaeota archaeon]